MRMQKIYAVNQGSYSDYRIVALFTTLNLAKEFMGAVEGSDYNEVEEYELNPKTADLVRRGYAPWKVHMLRDGTTERLNREDVDSYQVSSIGHAIWRRSEAPMYRGKGIPDCLVSTVWAKTENQALKIAN